VSNISQYMTKAMLDWCLLGATPTRPSSVFCGLSLGAPSSTSNSEVGAASGYARQPSSWAGAQTPSGSGSASNSTPMTFGPFSSSCVISGIFLIDQSTLATATNQLWYGNLTTVRTPLIGDSLVVAAGALQITLA
jgi:hypothetical protein